MKGNKDIFDKIFSLPVIRICNPIYTKYKMIFLYLLFGALTTAISIFSFILFDSILGINVLLANIFSWVLAVLFAYVTNRIWVFRSKAAGKHLLWEMALFFSARITSLLIEEALIFVLVVLLSCNSTWVKFFAQVIVLMLNYVFSKVIVFKKGEKQ